jgi:hypothetical protein
MKIRVLPMAGSVLLLALFGCSSPSASSPPTAKAGYVQGVITAKGSVWVNGVEYDTSASTVHVDGASGSDTDLKVGMTVQLSVTIDPVTGKAVAQTVNYESSVKGPVANIVQASGSAPGTFTVFGQTVQVLSTTVFEGTTDLTTLAASTFPVNFVEVSGQIDPATNDLVANRVEVKAAEADKLKGTVSNLNATSFTLTTEEGTAFLVNYTGTLNGIANGSAVRIEFHAADYNGTPSPSLTVTSMQIELRNTELHPNSGEGAEVEGVVAAYLAGDPATFTVEGQSVSAAASLIPSLTPIFGNGTRVEVSGTLSGSTLVATKVHAKKKDGDLLEAKGTVSATDLVAGTFTVHPASGADVVLAVDASTIFHSPAWTGTSPLSKLGVGTTVEVKYFTDTTVTPSVSRAVKVEP